MALFGKKAKTPAATEATPVGAPTSETTEETADFAADVFGSDETPAPTKKGKRDKAPKAAKTPKSRGVKNGTVVGLNIGNSLIKAVEVTAKNGEMVVTGVGVMVTPPECYSNGNILSVSALSGALKSLWKQSGFKSKNAILSVAGTGSLVVRVIEVPKMTDSELSDNMKVDADRYIPFPPSEVIMDFKALRDLPSDPDAPNMDVLLAAAQREVIDLHVKVVQNARLSPAAIDVEPVATVRAINLQRTNAGLEPDYDEVTALLNIGATGTEISVLRGDVIVFTRTLPNGGNTLTNAIAEAFGTSFSDAESQKKRNANALAPAGYASGGDDFTNFEQGFGGDMTSFSDDVFGTPGAVEASPFDDFGAATSSTPASSSDPFDMDFFNQGPKQNEPGAGHSQKEGEASENEPPTFNFSFNDDLSTMPAQADPNAPPPSPAQPGDVVAPSPIGFDFDKNLPAQEVAPVSELPASTPTSSPISATTAPTMPSAFDFSDFDLPSIAEPESGSIPVVPSGEAILPENQASAEAVSTFSGASANETPNEFSFGFSEAATIPGVGESAPTPASSEPQAPGLEPESDAILSREATSAPSPFSFGFASSPEANTSQQGSAPALSAETQTAPEAETAPMAFSFDLPVSEPASPPVSETVASDIPLSDAPVSNAPTSDAASSAPTDFDVMFSKTPESAPASQANEISFDTPAFDASAGNESAPTDSTVGAGAFGGMGVDDIQLGGEGGFDLGETNFGDDEAMNFGAGFGETAMDSDAAALYGALAPALDDLGNEVRRSLEYHLGRYPDTTFSKIYLVGGGANLKNIDQFFTESLGVPTEIVNPLRFVNVSVAKKEEEEIEALVSQLGTSCATALGLAIRDFVA